MLHFVLSIAIASFCSVYEKGNDMPHKWCGKILSRKSVAAPNNVSSITSIPIPSLLRTSPLTPHMLLKGLVSSLLKAAYSSSLRPHTLLAEGLASS